MLSTIFFCFLPAFATHESRDSMPAEVANTERFLAHLPLFTELEATDLARIAASVTQLDAPRRTVLFRRGEPCVGFHAVVYGQVKLAVRAAGGAEKVIDLVGPQQTFGEALMFLEKPYLVDAETLADTKLLFVPRDTVFAALDADPRIALRMLGALSARLHRLVSDLESYALRSGRQRVIWHLLSGLREDDSAGMQRVTLATSKGVIASRLNLTQEHFSRILRELSDAGLITVQGRDIIVPDITRLRSEAAV